MWKTLTSLAIWGHGGGGLARGTEMSANAALITMKTNVQQGETI